MRSSSTARSPSLGLLDGRHRIGRRRTASMRRVRRWRERGRGGACPRRRQGWNYAVGWLLLADIVPTACPARSDRGANRPPRCDRPLINAGSRLPRWPRKVLSGRRSRVRVPSLPLHHGLHRTTRRLEPLLRRPLRISFRASGLGHRCDQALLRGTGPLARSRPGSVGAFGNPGRCHDRRAACSVAH
jgi:hypothetical protein